MITLRWTKFPEADVTHYKIYRSIVGYVAPLADMTGKTLQLKIDGGPLQTINFTSDDIVTEINNQIRCAAAYPSYDGINYLLRSNTREAPGSVEIVGGSTGYIPRLITEKSENILIATVADPTTEYEDQDGTPSDYYSISTVNSQGVESVKSLFRKAIPTCGPMCVIEGLVMNAQGARIADAEVTATIQVPVAHISQMVTINKDPITVFTGPDGRFSLPLLQGLVVRLEIPAIGMIKMCVVPELNYIFINDLKTDDRYQYPLGYQGQGAQY